jgi:hypothetical protein
MQTVFSVAMEKLCPEEQDKALALLPFSRQYIARLHFPWVLSANYGTFDTLQISLVWSCTCSCQQVLNGAELTRLIRNV